MNIDIKAIKKQCENMAMQAKCFRKTISNIDPVANSPMTDTNIPIKVLADWGRNACDTLARQDLPDCLDEIERLRASLEDMCYQFAYWSEKDGGGLWTSGMSSLEGAFETLGWDDPHTCPDLQCDEPGCKKQSSCGWPSDKGYRRTCSGHRKI